MKSKTAYSIRGFVQLRRDCARLRMASHLKDARRLQLEGELAIREDSLMVAARSVEEDFLAFENFLRNNRLKLKTLTAESDALSRVKLEKNDKVNSLINECDELRSEVSKVSRLLMQLQPFLSFVSESNGDDLKDTYEMLEYSILHDPVPSLQEQLSSLLIERLSSMTIGEMPVHVAPENSHQISQTLSVRDSELIELVVDLGEKKFPGFEESLCEMSTFIDLYAEAQGILCENGKLYLSEEIECNLEIDRKNAQRIFQKSEIMKKTKERLLITQKRIESPPKHFKRSPMTRSQNFKNKKDLKRVVDEDIKTSENAYFGVI